MKVQLIKSKLDMFYNYKSIRPGADIAQKHKRYDKALQSGNMFVILKQRFSLSVTIAPQPSRDILTICL